MDANVATVLGTAIGAVTGLGGGLLSGWIQARHEREKRIRDRHDVLANELRVALQQLTVNLASAAHSMCWLTWLAKEGPTRLTQERIDAYDRELHDLLPQITGQQATIAGFDRFAFEQLSELVSRVLQADARIGKASLQFAANNPASAAALGECYQETQSLERAIPQQVADILARSSHAPSTR